MEKCSKFPSQCKKISHKKRGKIRIGLSSNMLSKLTYKCSTIYENHVYSAMRRMKIILFSHYSIIDTYSNVRV